VETKLFAKDFSSNCIRFVEINNLPFLSLGSIVAIYLDFMTFFIFATLNIKDLIVGPVDELVVLVLEDLEPS
jgi:hypothetical protein